MSKLLGRGLLPLDSARAVAYVSCGVVSLARPNACRCCLGRTCLS